MQNKSGEWGVENGWDWEMCHTFARIPVPSCASRGVHRLIPPTTHVVHTRVLSSLLSMLAQ